ncbi:MAG TPA: hypothetical protein ENN05_02245 [Deltaproteobacteria bacterium]|nr:hypothetical protein [Deltaproteobacteria bacterium]
MKKIMTVLILALILYGCSNDSLLEGTSDTTNLEAQIEDAARALDDGNYHAVIAGLSSYYTTKALNPDVARLLASGYMGAAGIDVTNLIAYSYNKNADSFDMVEATLFLTEASEDATCNAMLRMVLIFDDDAPYAVFIDGRCIVDLIEYLDNAKDIFYSLRRLELATYDDYVQLGLASAVHYVLNLGNATADTLNPLPPEHTKYVAGIVPAPINKAAYQYYRSDLSDYDWDDIDEHAYDEELNEDGLSPYQQDLIDVSNAVTAISRKSLQQNNLQPKQNDLQDQLDGFLREILMMPSGGITTAIITEKATTTGIYEYINLISSEEVTP